MNGVNIALGYALASYMGMAFFFADDPAAKWRGPLGIALLWPIMMIGVVFIVPESPRFLLMKGEVEKARAIVMRLHSVKGDPDQEFARSEFYQMQKQTEWVCQTPFIFFHLCGKEVLSMGRFTYEGSGPHAGSGLDRHVHQKGLPSPHSIGYGIRLRRPEYWCARC
jgi:hypothetical protein